LLQLVVGALTTLSTNLLVGLGLRLVFKLRCILFEHVQKLSLAFHDTTSVGDSLYRVTWDSYAPQALVNSAIIPALSASLTLAGIGAVMLTRDWALTMAAAAVAVPLFLLIRRLDRPLTAGDVVLLVGYVVMLYKPLETLASIAVAVQGGMAGSRRVFAVLDATPDIADAPDAVALPRRAAGQIVLERVWFAYRGGEPVLRDVSLAIRPGQALALVGGSGAGKSTLASLLLRFYDPTAGRILLDGQDVRRLTLRSLREQVAVVLQEPVLFAASIRENIAYGRPEASREEIEAAARAAGAHEFVTALPQGYDTRIGERGATL